MSLACLSILPEFIVQSQQLQSCCRQIYINGTFNKDPWYQSMMGVYIPYEVLINNDFGKLNLLKLVCNSNFNSVPPLIEDSRWKNQTKKSTRLPLLYFHFVSIYAAPLEKIN